MVFDEKGTEKSVPFLIDFKISGALCEKCHLRGSLTSLTKSQHFVLILNIRETKSGAF